jgi:uncharacterized protein YmfQ (DUF2313 family)
MPRSADRYWRSIGDGPVSWLPPVVVPLPRYDAITYDRHIRRSGEDYVQPLTYQFPQGQAWPKWDLDSNFMRWVQGSAQIWGDVDSRAADLLERESDPRMTIELLPDWERAFGLPDKCLSEPLTIGDRQKTLVHRITMQGGQSRQFFFDYASAIGQQIQIIEHSPFTCGISEVGDTRGQTDSGWWRWEIGDEHMRFYWTIAPAVPRLTWFRTGGVSELGKDHFLEIGIFTDAECIWNRLKPAHTELAFDFGSLVPISKYQGL